MSVLSICQSCNSAARVARRVTTLAGVADSQRSGALDGAGDDDLACSEEMADEAIFLLSKVSLLSPTTVTQVPNRLPKANVLAKIVQIERKSPSGVHDRARVPGLRERGRL